MRFFTQLCKNYVKSTILHSKSKVMLHKKPHEYWINSYHAPVAQWIEQTFPNLFNSIK